MPVDTSLVNKDTFSPSVSEIARGSTRRRGVARRQ
jgi:hypothetical protein